MRSNAQDTGFEATSENQFRIDSLHHLLGMETAFLYAAKYIAESLGLNPTSQFKDIVDSFPRIKLQTILRVKRTQDRIESQIEFMNAKDEGLQKYLVETYIDIDKFADVLAKGNIYRESEGQEFCAQILLETLIAVSELRKKINRYTAQLPLDSTPRASQTIPRQLLDFFQYTIVNDELKNKKSNLICHDSIQNAESKLLDMKHEEQTAFITIVLRDVRFGLHILYDKVVEGLTFAGKLKPHEPVTNADEYGKYLEKDSVSQLFKILSQLPEGKIKDKARLGIGKRLQYLLDTVNYLIKQLQSNQSPHIPMIPLDKLKLDNKNENDKKAPQLVLDMNLNSIFYPAFARVEFIASKTKFIYSARLQNIEHEKKALQDAARNQTHTENEYPTPLVNYTSSNDAEIADINHLWDLTLQTGVSNICTVVCEDTELEFKHVDDRPSIYLRDLILNSKLIHVFIKPEKKNEILSRPDLVKSSLSHLRLISLFLMDCFDRVSEKFISVDVFAEPVPAWERLDHEFNYEANSILLTLKFKPKKMPDLFSQEIIERYTNITALETFVSGIMNDTTKASYILEALTTYYLDAYNLYHQVLALDVPQQDFPARTTKKLKFISQEVIKAKAIARLEKNSTIKSVLTEPAAQHAADATTQRLVNLLSSTRTQFADAKLVLDEKIENAPTPQNLTPEGIYKSSLPAYFNTNIFILLYENATESEKEYLDVTRFYASLFVVKLIKKYSLGAASLSCQFQHIYDQLRHIMLDANLSEIKNINQFPEIKFPDSFGRTYEKFIVTTQVNLDDLAMLMTQCQSLRDPNIRTNEFQKLLIDALEAARYSYERLKNITPANPVLANDAVGIFNQHFQLIKTCFMKDRISHGELELLSSEKISFYMAQASLVSESEKLVMIAQLNKELLAAISACYNKFYSIGSNDLTTFVDPSDAAYYSSMLQKYGDDDALAKFNAKFQTIPKESRDKYIEKIVRRFAYLMDALGCQLGAFKNNPTKPIASSLADFYMKFLSIKSASAIDTAKETKGFSKKSPIDYSIHNPAIGNKLKLLSDEIKIKRLRLFNADKLLTTSVYYTDAYERALVDTQILRDYILNTRLTSRFLKTSAINEDLSDNPIKFTDSITRLAIACLVLGKGFNSLSGNTLSENIVITFFKDSTDVDLLWAYDQHGADNRKLLCATGVRFTDNPNAIAYNSCMRYIDFFALQDYLNMLLKGDIKDALLELAKLYLDAQNMYTQLRLLRLPLEDKSEQRCVTFVDVKTLRQRMDSLNKIKGKTLFDLMVPNTPQAQAKFVLTPPPVIIATEERERKKYNAIKKGKSQKHGKSAGKKKSTITGYKTSESDTSSDAKSDAHGTTCNESDSEDEKIQSIPPTTTEMKSAIPDKAAINFKYKTDKLAAGVETLSNLLKMSKEHLDILKTTFQSSFTSRIVNDRDNLIVLKKEIGDIAITREEINTSLKLLINNFDNSLTSENIDLIDSWAAQIFTSFSEMRTRIQNLRPRIAKEQFQLERELKAKKIQEEAKLKRIDEKHEARPRPAAHVPAPASTPSQQLALTPVKTKKYPPAEKSDQDRSGPRRLEYLNQSCKHLIFLRKILDCQTEEEEKRIYTPDVTHFALLFNIFRCFQSLKMYQALGGSNKNISEVLVTDLRNMIIHHGAMIAEEDEVLQFAKTLQGTLPEIVINLQTENLLRFEVRDDIRAEIIVAFNLTEITPLFSLRNNHTNLVVDSTAFYRSLHDFHQSKTDNNSPPGAIKGEINFVYIPAIKKIFATLYDKNYDMTPERFVETFMFEIQALLMLVTIVGELGSMVGFNDSFVTYCKDYRNIVGHALNEMNNHDDYVKFVNGLKMQLNKAGNYRGQFFSVSSSVGSRPTSSTALPSPAPK